MSEKRRAITALTMSTFAFTVCFACWVINAILATSLVSSGVFNFSSAQLGWLLALPILTGAVMRVPLGIMTDRFGGRIVFPVLMLLVAIPMFLLSYAQNYTHFLLASLGFGMAGASFAVGIGFTSVWFSQKRQGTALGIFGMGNAGAAITTIAAPYLLAWFTKQGANPEGWRYLPKAYAVVLAVTAIAFFLVTTNRKPPETRSLVSQLAPLRSIVVWRFGLYYFLVFGGFVAFAQWLVPYSLNVYQISLKEAGLLAAAFSLPSGIIRALGGWMSDRFGARSVMTGVFWTCIFCALFLSVPKMDIFTPGKGVMAQKAGTVGVVSQREVRVGQQSFSLIAPPIQLPSRLDKGNFIFPKVVTWHEPLVKQGATVSKKQLLARGVSNIYYPSNLWIFAVLVFIFGAATGIGKAAVYKFIPDQFPHAVGAVGGMVGLLGAMGGFILPPVFGYLLTATGLWSSCWMVLLLLSIVCLIWMLWVVRRFMHQEAPVLSELIERRPWIELSDPVDLPEHEQAKTVEELLHHLSYFDDLTPEELKQLAQTGHWISIGAGKTVFHEGDPGDSLYIILKGQVKVHQSDGQGKEVELATLKKGGFVGELALLDGEPRSAHVTTVGPCDFFVLSRPEFLALLSKSPHMLSHILAGLSTAIRQSNKRLLEQSTTP